MKTLLLFLLGLCTVSLGAHAQTPATVKITVPTASYPQLVGGMNCVAIRYTVTDFETWKKSHELHKVKRQSVGFTSIHTFQESDNPEKITVMYGVTDLSAARNILENGKLSKFFKTDEVKSIESIDYFHVYNSGIAQSETFFITRCAVKEYNQWKKDLDNNFNTLRANGITIIALGRENEESKEVILVLNAADKTKLTEFLKGPTFKTIAGQHRQQVTTVQNMLVLKE
jgi:hypothetical protein